MVLRWESATLPDEPQYRYGRNEVYEELMQQRRSSVEDPDAYSFDDVLDEIRMRLDDPRIERNRLAEMDGMLLSSCRGYLKSFL